MNEFALQITNGCKPIDIAIEYKNSFDELIRIGALKENSSGLLELTSIYRIGLLYLNKDGKGFVEALNKTESDLLIESENLMDSKTGDLVVAKRIMAARGRATGKVIMIAQKAHMYTIAYTHYDELGNFAILSLRNGEPTTAFMSGVDLKILKSGTVLKIDIDTDEVSEIIGNLDDPRIDEKLSLMLFEREDEFPAECLEQAKLVPLEVDRNDYPNRVDLTGLDFCTIDPVTAKDFDDAVYFDTKEYVLYVAIADVSHYVDYFSPIDIEAKKRGFTTYLPHKSFPMLPRELSENLCSLKPRVDRLAFVAKIELDRVTLESKSEEFFEAIIHSKHRFHYDEIDKLLETNGADATGVVAHLWESLKPLYEITQKLRATRLKAGFDFRSEEIKLSIDSNHLLKSTQAETGTPSHSLIEECMLLANKASAKRFTGENDSVFRIHEPPQLSKIEELLGELATVGIFVEKYDDSPSLIRAIQKEADVLNIANEVDAMIIKSLKQASYTPTNVGHFGLGFTHYSHFTSPIRRYSDLILHRLIKTQLDSDTKEREYLLRNITPLCARVSELERKTTKCEWDFRDRKFARWADTHKNELFKANIIKAGDNAKAILACEMSGITVNIRGAGLMLFDRIEVEISEVNIAQATIMSSLIRKLDIDEMEL